MIDVTEIKKVLIFLEKQTLEASESKELDFGGQQFQKGESSSYSHIIQMIENMENGVYKRAHFAPKMKE